MSEINIKGAMSSEESQKKVTTLQACLAIVITLCFAGAIGCFCGGLELKKWKEEDPARCEKKIAVQLERGNIDGAIHTYESFKGYKSDVNPTNILEYLLQSGDYERAIQFCLDRGYYQHGQELSSLAVNYFVQNQQYEYAEKIAQKKGEKFYYGYMELCIIDMCERGNIKEARAFKTEKIKWFTDNGYKKERWKYEKEFNTLIKKYSSLNK